jgi:hypothetical protein
MKINDEEKEIDKVVGESVPHKKFFTLKRVLAGLQSDKRIRTYPLNGDNQHSVEMIPVPVVRHVPKVSSETHSDSPDSFITMKQSKIKIEVPKAPNISSMFYFSNIFCIEKQIFIVEERIDPDDVATSPLHENEDGRRELFYWSPSEHYLEENCEETIDKLQLDDTSSTKFEGVDDSNIHPSPIDIIPGPSTDALSSAITEEFVDGVIEIKQEVEQKNIEHPIVISTFPISIDIKSPKRKKFLRSLFCGVRRDKMWALTKKKPSAVEDFPRDHIENGSQIKESLDESDSGTHQTRTEVCNTTEKSTNSIDIEGTCDIDRHEDVVDILLVRAK